ncbi:MAG TPA: DolP-mannose mannosyltransferase [Blastocatellia bacterium]|nr:DolP-mannose mannosyltransferase [Blastocatellia bacterium]
MDEQSPPRGIGLGLANKLDQFLTRRRDVVLCALFLTAVILVLHSRQYLCLENGDPSLWDYTAQSILRGQIPYRDVVQIKTPLSAYLSALVLVAAKPLGVNGLIAIRFVKILLAAGLLVTTYALAELYLTSRAAALIAFLAPLGLQAFAARVSTGTEQKLPMIFFGVLALLLIAKDKPFWAGLVSMLSCLSWQPGLLFTGTAVLVCSNYLRSWRDLRAVKVTIGAALPLLVTILYFHHQGALGDFWKWTFAYNLTVYAPYSVKTLSEQIRHVSLVTRRSLGVRGTVVLCVAFLGYVVSWASALRGKHNGNDIQDTPPNLQYHAILIAPLVYLIYLRFDFNAGPYLIPLYPFIGIFLGSLVTVLVRSARSRWKGATASRTTRIAETGVIGLLCYQVIAVCFFGMYSGPTLYDQYEEIAPISRLVTPGDSLYCQGQAAFLVMLDRPSVSKYLWFDRGKGDFAARGLPGGFQAIMAKLEAHAPKIVQAARFNDVAHRQEIEDWLATHYEPMGLRYFDLYIRKEAN